MAQKTIPLSVLRKLIDSESSQLRRRYAAATDESTRENAPLNHMSRGRLIEGILRYELHATEILTSDE